MNKLLLITLLIFSTVNAQQNQNIELNNSNELKIPEKDQIKIALKMGVEDEDLQTYFDFDNISQSKFTISRPSVKNKAYIIKLKDSKMVN